MKRVVEMEDLGKELEEVENELAVVQTELDVLLQKQEELLERKELLKTQLESLEGSRVRQQNAKLLSQDWENGDFPWSSQLLSVLKSTFRIEKFRHLQASCINATLSNKDTILIMPTGAGKSLCYQLPAVLSKGFTLIVSPLVSLMEDQLLSVKNLGIESCALNASTSREDLNHTHNQMTQKESALKLLYVTPEKLSKSKRFMSKLEKAYESGRLSRIVIDEVHCASQWGHDFRPDYKILGILKRQFPTIPILGLTATATSKVLEEVKEMLSLKECLILRASYNRSNLFYEVRLKSSVHKTQMDTMVALIKRRFTTNSGIVYCFSRKDTEVVASGLCEKGIRAAHYHADLSPAQRSKVHMKWLDNSIQVIVATVAFGMGIDKPDVRFVIHHTISKSMENYYQESGRAGRDGNPAHCIIYFRAADAFRQSTMVFTEHTGLSNLYSMLRYCLNKVECRRALIARCFGERWTESDCNSSCDICHLHPLASTSGGKTAGATSGDFISARGKVTTLYESVEEDITGHCQSLIEIVESVKGKEKRLTALKVVEMWQAKLKKLKPPSSLTAEECECILLQAVLEGVLKEEFHFTPYSTISYIGLGRKAGSVQRGVAKIKVRKREASRSKGDQKKAAPSTSSTVNQTQSSEGATGSSKMPVEARGKQKGLTTSNSDLDVSSSREPVKRKLPQMLLSSAQTSGKLSSDFLLPQKRFRLAGQKPEPPTESKLKSNSSASTSAVIEIDSD